MVDIGDSAGKNGAFGLFARPVGYDAAEFIDSFIYVATTAAFNLFLNIQSASCRPERNKITNMVILSLTCPFFCPYGRVPPSTPGMRDGGC